MNETTRPQTSNDDIFCSGKSTGPIATTMTLFDVLVGMSMKE